jgi:hypothetical protein
MREKARECRRLLPEDVDPLDHRQAQCGAAQMKAAKAMTLDRCAEAYIDAHKAAWKFDKRAAQWRRKHKAYDAPGTFV